MSAPPIVPVGLVDAMPATAPMQALGPVAGMLPASGASFAQLMASGVEQVEHRIAAADTLARAFALDDSIPVHQVTFALEQAKMSLELMLQVRTRLVEGYQQIMNMQL